MLSHFYPNINIKKISVRRYNALLQQAFNIGSWKAGGKIELETQTDKQKRADREYQELKAKGKWKKNGGR